MVAILGGILLTYKVPNLSISGLALSISIVIPFLNMTRQFAGMVGQISSEVNAVVMGIAGAKRVFALMDEMKEEDSGHIRLVSVKDQDGELVETADRTEMWAWKDVKEDGTIVLKRLLGDVELRDVDFSYDGKRMILKGINVFAHPGEKVAFVGATGAGKTTITNLLNRFYSIQKGEIIYDGFDVYDICLGDLRRSLGIILQDTVLFTGTVMENIRYGKLDASDEECIAAARLAGADDFITRLPNGYDTELSGNGGNLSQGQKQLLCIARVMLMDPAILILDEATSSIDTRTEQKVQSAFQEMLKGRTAFIVAHRLSTIQNADCILVMKDGNIIEKGSHNALLRENGFYKELYESQFQAS